MDFYALQQKLFELDPVDPKEDLARLKAQAQGSANIIPKETVDYLQESVAVPEGSLKMDRNYSVNDFAALAGVVVEKKQRDADQVRGKEPMPKAEPGRTRHPYQDRLVGDSIDNDKDDRIAALERRVEALESMLNERELSKKEIRKRDQYADDLPDAEFKSRYGDDWESVKYGTATNIAKRKNRSNESIDSIKDALYAALNKKMGD
jgi:hypothetical protein